MQFRHTWQAILEGLKTQTRRRALPEPDGTGEFPCEMICYPDGVMAVQRYTPDALYWRTRWQVGHTYAVQPGRSKPAIARIRITDIRREDVRQISEEDALAEGFEDQKQFWETWIEMHDKTFLETYLYAADCDCLREYGFFERPSARYDAWALSFEVLK